jgi:hypothetical protein
MADILKWVEREFQKRYRDMLDGSHAEVVAVGGLPDVGIVGEVEVEQADPDDLNANANLQVGDVDASATNPVPERGFMARFDVTLTLDTNIYASNDLLADTQIVAGVCVNSRGAVLYDMRVIDLNDQGQAMDILFLRSNTSLGTENLAYAPTDAMGLEIIKKVPIYASDFVDQGAYREAQKSLVDGIGCVLEPLVAGTSIWIAAVCRGGTPTYTANGVHVQFGAIQNG